MDWTNYSVEGQMSIFDLTRPAFKINKHIRLIELFAGVGSQAMALRDLGADFEHYRVVEFDKYAIASYNAIHGTVFPTMDITKVNGSDLGIVDTDKHCYIMTYSFPCQDLSVAGLGKGMTKGSGTRSGLLWEVERLLNEVDNLPQVLLMENVPQVHGKKNMDDFQRWIEFLERKGYSNFWQDLNAKNYGVAQNRNRCFMVSVLGNYNYTFPNTIELEKTLKYYLEDVVDDKFYLSKKMFNYAFNMIKEAKGIGFSDSVDGSCINPPIANTIGCRSAEGQRSCTSNYVSDEFDEPLQVRDMKDIILGGMQKNQSVKTDGVCTTLTSSMGCGGGYVPMVAEPKGLFLSDKGKKYILSPKRGMCTDINADVCQTLTAKGQNNWTGSFVSPDIENIEKSTTIGSTEPTKIHLKDGSTITSDDDMSQLRIRKLTPKECWRLMCFADEDFEKAAEVNSNTQLYKQAGNSIVKNVLVAILGQMIEGKENIYKEVR